jgi:hypothetical protein
MKKSQWRTVKDLINSRKIGDCITRQEIISDIYNGPAPKRDKWCTSYGYTLDFYIACLKRMNIIRNIERGIYEVCYHIKPNASSKEVQKIAYHSYYPSWRHWFNDIYVLED